MSNLPGPWGGKPQPGREPWGEHPTEQILPGAAAPGPGEHPRPGRGRRWALGIVAASLLTVGGIIAGLALAGHPAPTASASPATAAGRQGVNGQAALLGATLGNAGAPGPLMAAASPAAGGQQGALAGGGRRAGICARAGRLAQAARRSGFPRVAWAARRLAHRCRLAHRRIFAFFLMRGVDGQFTIRTPQGPVSRAFERGVIESVSPGHSLVVKTTGATPVTWTWQITASTVVRDRAGKISQNSLSDGEQVWVGGPVVSGAKNARLIVANPPGPPTGG